MAPAPYVINTFVGDRSGSMSSMHEQLKRGVRDYTRDMREMAQSGTKVRFELYAFDDKIKRPFNGDPKNLAEQDIDYLTTHFTPNGTTRLYDTVIRAVQSQNMAEKNILENLTPSEQKVFRQLDGKVPKVLSVARCSGLRTGSEGTSRRVVRRAEWQCRRHWRRLLRRVAAAHGMILPLRRSTGPCSMLRLDIKRRQRP